MNRGPLIFGAIAMAAFTLVFTVCRLPDLAGPFLAAASVLAFLAVAVKD